MTVTATFRQYLASITSQLCVTMTGAGFVWLTPLMVWLVGPESEIPMTTTDTSWLVASIEIGELFSPIPVGILADKWGRKPWILSTGPLCIISWIFVLTSRSIVALYAMRIIQGFTVGIVYTVVPVYVAEISEPRIRGELCGQFQTLWYIGILFAYCSGPFLSYQNYAYACAALPFIFLVTFVFMPESPYFLLMKGRVNDAEKSLQWLRGTDDVQDELQRIRHSVDQDMKCKVSWKDLIATKADRKSLLIVQVVCFVKYLNGTPAIVSYSTQTFAETTQGQLNEHQLTIGIGVILCLTTFFAAYVSDSVGRRPLLIISSIGTMIFTGVIGMYYFLDTETTVDVTQYYWIMYISVVGFLVVSSIGLGPLLQTIQAEFFPSHTRSLGGGITGISGCIATFINLKQYQMVTDAAGVYLNYWIFSISALIGSILLCLVIPETAGKSLGEIQTSIRNENVEFPIQNGKTNLEAEA